MSRLPSEDRDWTPPHASESSKDRKCCKTGEKPIKQASRRIPAQSRISDVALFQIDRMQTSGEIRVRTTKAGIHVYTWVPQWLQDRIRARAKLHGDYIFGSHTTKDLDVITDLWRRKLNKVWDMCGTWKEKPTPHRFRHYAEFRTMPSKLSAPLPFRVFPKTRLGIVCAGSSHGCWSNGNSIRLLHLMTAPTHERLRP
jgi:hypothetical protein